MAKMNRGQQVFGEPSTRTRAKVRIYMSEWVQEFIKHSPFAVMASSNLEGCCDASPKGGKPGFVKVLDETHLLIPDVAGNKLFQTYENFETNPNLGLIFFIPGIDASVRVNGQVKMLSESDGDYARLTLEVFNKDENSKLLQAIVLEVSEAYSHCPRALGFSKLWDTDTIQINQDISPIEPWRPGT